MQLDKEKIIKALEWCIQSESCEYCEYKSDIDVCSIKDDALSLIINLAEENEKIGIENFDLICELSRIRKETVRKMQSEIKERCIKGGIFPAFVASTIDEIAKEMLEGNDG